MWWVFNAINTDVILIGYAKISLRDQSIPLEPVPHKLSMFFSQLGNFQQQERIFVVVVKRITMIICVAIVVFRFIVLIIVAVAVAVAVAVTVATITMIGGRVVGVDMVIITVAVNCAACHNFIIIITIIITIIIITIIIVFIIIIIITLIVCIAIIITAPLIVCALRYRARMIALHDGSKARRCFKKKRKKKRRKKKRKVNVEMDTYSA